MEAIALPKEEQRLYPIGRHQISLVKNLQHLCSMDPNQFNLMDLNHLTPCGYQLHARRMEQYHFNPIYLLRFSPMVRRQEEKNLRPTSSGRSVVPHVDVDLATLNLGEPPKVRC